MAPLTICGARPRAGRCRNAVAGDNADCGCTLSRWQRSCSLFWRTGTADDDWLSPFRAHRPPRRVHADRAADRGGDDRGAGGSLSILLRASRRTKVAMSLRTIHSAQVCLLRRRRLCKLDDLSKTPPARSASSGPYVTNGVIQNGYVASVGPPTARRRCCRLAPAAAPPPTRSRLSPSATRRGAGPACARSPSARAPCSSATAATIDNALSGTIASLSSSAVPPFLPNRRRVPKQPSRRRPFSKPAR